MAVSGKKASKGFSSFTTSIESESQEDFQVYCQPCDEDGTRLPAHGFCTDCKQHLCKTCFTVHKKHKLSKHHILLDVTSMPKTLQQSSASSPACQSDELNRPCLKHIKETIKFFCHDHKELLCNVCVTLEHQSSLCKVSYIPDISGSTIDNKEYQDILKAMNNMFEQCINIEAHVRKLTSDSNKSLQTALAEIKRFRKVINQRLDEMEKQAEDAANAVQKENSKHLKTIERKCGEIKTSLKTSSDLVKQHNKFKQPDKLFVELKLAEKAGKGYEETTQQLTSCDVQEYIFKPNEIISKLLNTENSLGLLTKKTSHNISSAAGVQRKARKASYQGEICVKTYTDETKCEISGMIILTQGVLIISDWENEAVKMVDTDMQSVTHQLQLDNKPWDIAKVESTEAAVTLPDNQTIQFISVSSNKLKIKRSIKTDGKCGGISCYHNRLAVSLRYPARLQILDMNGTVHTTIERQNILISPFSVKANNSFIYVSDSLNNKVIQFNWQGEIKGSYEITGKLRGIELLHDGTIFVCILDRNVIEEISADFTTEKIILKNLKGPLNVCCCGETKNLYYNCNTEKDTDVNYLQIFRLS